MNDTPAKAAPLSDRDLLGAHADMKRWQEATLSELEEVEDALLAESPPDASRLLLRRNWLRGTYKALSEAITCVNNVKRHRQ